MILTNSGVLKLMQRIKSFITAQLNTKAASVHTHTISEIDNLSTLTMGGGGYSKSEVDTLLTGKSDTSHTHTKSQITDFPSYGTTANTICEGNDSRLSDARTPTSHTHTKSEITDFPTIPTVNNATLTIQKNGTTVKTFTANASSDVTCNITVPTKTSELTNDSGFLTSHQSLSNYSTLANTIKSLSISGKTITYTKGDNTTGTLTTQDNNTWTAMVGATSSSNGSVGYVNAVPPKDGYNTKYLRADGTWQVPPDHTYTVNNATLTIQKNGTTVKTFTANASSDVTCNITVPTKVSELTNDSNFVESTDLSSVATSGSYADLSNKPTIPTVNNATLTIQKNGTDVKTFTANASSDVTCNITVPTKVSELTNDSGFLTSHQDLSGYVPRSGGAVFENYMYSRSVNDDVLRFTGGTTWANGAGLALFGKDRTSDAGVIFLKADNGTSFNQITLYPNGMFTQNVNKTIKHVAMQEDTVPRSGGSVISGERFYRTSSSGMLAFGSGTTWCNGGMIELFGATRESKAGCVNLQPALTDRNYKTMSLQPSGTWTWSGTACQITSDQRFKQQISEIDDDLLDAWEDVDLVQFKYNDAVEQKGDNARLHTGYVVQQINEACQKHDVDISAYGLYCHEEYPEMTEEVTIEKEDGTTTKETKVVEPAKEHYSLRYTETLVVECAYLRRENAKLKEQLRNHEDYLKLVEEHLHLKNL